MTAITYEYAGALYVNMTNACSNRCEFCLRDNSSGSLYASDLWYHGKEPAKEEMLENILGRELSIYREIVFCGYGEPACRFDDMMWLCDEIKKRGDFSIRVNTNGQSDLITGKKTAPFLKGRVDCVSVSLNASTPEKYDEICHSIYGLQALPAILQFASEAAQYVPRVVMTVVSTMGEDEIERCRVLCEKTGALFKIREYISA